MEYSSELHDAQVIVPHSDWRGTYDRGTTIMGSCVVYSSNGTQLAPPPDSTPTNPDQYGGVAGGGGYGGTKEHCIDVDWPAAYTWSARQYRRGYSGPDAWMGSLIFESRDGVPSGAHSAKKGTDTMAPSSPCRSPRNSFSWHSVVCRTLRKPLRNAHLN
jgi:hypothetical protein